MNTITTQTIKIAIGDGEITFHAIDTTAPKDYDGFGTFTLADYGDSRTVLVGHDHFDWQITRYTSGCHKADASAFDMQDIEQTLWDRLRGVFQS